MYNHQNILSFNIFFPFCLIHLNGIKKIKNQIRRKKRQKNTVESCVKKNHTAGNLTTTDTNLQRADFAKIL